MAVDRGGPPEDQDPERKKTQPDAVAPREDNPFAKNDQDSQARAAEQHQLVETDQAKHPRRLPGRPSEGVAQDHEASSSADNEATSQAIDGLKNEGHGPQRHVEVDGVAVQRRLGTAAHDHNGDVLYRPSDGHVKKQPGTQIDPATGTSTDAETGGLHYCGPYATRFIDPADYVYADQILRKRVQATRKLDQTVAISSLFPDKDANDRFAGQYQDPAQPENTDGSPRFKDIDFTGGRIRARYVRNDDDSVALRTMYPDPDHSRNT